MIQTRGVHKGLHKHYLQKAEEYYQAMQEEYAKRRFNSCALCAIHCGISAADAVTVFFKGVRHVGDRHEDVVQLLDSLEVEPETIKHKTKQLLAVLETKNRVEYEENLTTESGAALAMKSIERFFSWAKQVCQIK